MGSKIKSLDVLAKKRGAALKDSLKTGTDKQFNRAVESKFRKGTTGKRKEAEKRTMMQMQKEKLSLAESESEIATRKASATSGKAGRRSLIKSTQGLSATLGGMPSA